MTMENKIQILFEQITELPDTAQNELIEALVEMRTEHLGLHPFDGEEREGSTCNIEIFASVAFSDEQIDQMYLVTADDPPVPRPAQ